MRTKDNRLLIVAGPCSAESEEQVFETANSLQKIGTSIFRAGLWKPRTHPNSFSGVGAKGLPWLQRVQDEIGLPVATEVATPEHVRLCMEHSIRVLWIGARTTTNPFMVQQIADEIASIKGEKPMLLIKNPISPDINLWLGAIERFQKVGAKDIIAVHRGFYSTYSAPLRNMPCWAIPIELKRILPDIPIICDPSHITGNANMVPDMAFQALQIGFDGLMIECHKHPEQALSDAEQQITPEQLGAILRTIHSRTDGNNATNNSDTVLISKRKQIDEIDNELWQLIAKRLDIAQEIGEYKRDHSLPIFQSARYNDILKKRLDWGNQHNISEAAIQKIIEILHEESIRRQL